MPEMAGYNPQTLKMVYFQEFSQLKSDSKGSLYKKMAQMTLRSHQHHVERQLSCKKLDS